MIFKQIQAFNLLKLNFSIYLHSKLKKSEICRLNLKDN